MCGIAGFIQFKKNKNFTQDHVLRNMIKVIAHRGPDDEGIWSEENICMGHKRLSIIDLTSTGHQPMFSSNKRYVITFNGEIYNFKELKNDLIKKGNKFYSTSDTEVILSLYAEHKQKIASLLNGIFAFAIWDRKEKELFVTRDHFGVKPLYYYLDNNKFIFASEIKSILAYPEIEKNMDEESLDLLLTFRHTPAPKTLFKNIFKLEPAHQILIKNNTFNKKCYWNYSPLINNSLSENNYIDKLQHLYFEATKRQMISDAPLGISLSGGVDSGALLAIMSQISDRPVKAFTVGFEGGGKTNELKDAEKTAKLFGADFYPYEIKIKDYLDFFDHYIWHLEEPIGNDSAAAYYFVAREAQKHVKVLINGQGIDELMGGYNRHIGGKYSELYQKIPSIFRKKIISPFVKSLPQNEALKRAVISLDEKNITERLLKIYTILHLNEKEKLYKKEYYTETKKNNLSQFFEEYKNRVNNLSFLEQLLYIDVRTSLSDNLLLCEDKMAMAASVEARVPFLDVPLVEFIETIPESLRIKKLQGKYIHKKAVQKWLPKSKIYVKKKGFDNPIDKWLGKNMNNFMKDLLFDKNSISSHYFNLSYLSNLYKNHISRKENYTKFLFLLMSIELWNKKFLSK